MYPHRHGFLIVFHRVLRNRKAAIRSFIEGLAVSEAVKAELRAVTPFNYTGITG